jgi:hypothetical protein
MTKLLTLILWAALASAQTLTITGPGSVKAGSTFTLGIGLSGTGTTGDQAFQFSLSGISSWTIAPVRGTAATTANKTVSCAAVGVSYNCIVAGLNTATLVDGQQVVLTVTVPRNAGSGTTTVSASSLLAAATDANGSANGVSLVAPVPFTLSVTSACDLDGNGVIDATDLATAMQQVVGVGACSADLNSDGVCNVIDVQIIANAPASGKCAAK